MVGHACAASIQHTIQHTFKSHSHQTHTPKHTCVPPFMQAFLRPNVAQQGIVPHAAARGYFGPSTQGTRSARGSLCGGVDLFHLTPYANSSLSRLYARGSSGDDGKKKKTGLWRAVKGTQVVDVHWYRWRVGLDRRLSDMLRHARCV